MKKCQLEKEAHNTREEGAREVEERKRTRISASAVSFLGFHAVINQPEGMLQLKVLSERTIGQHTWTWNREKKREQGGLGLCLRTI
jgi:hypothetical protein